MNPPCQEEDLFCAEESTQETSPVDTWKVMIVDDEEDIHHITRFVLSDYVYQGKRLEFLHAYSVEETKCLCQQHHDIAVAFLDVVMETNDAGLKLVEYIRDTLQNRLVRIVLRTGQPGYAPETEVILKYDINDYVNKTELTDQRLFTLITTNLRAYSEMMTIELNRQALASQEANRRKVIEELSQLNKAYERFVPRQFLSFLNKKSILDISLGDQIEISRYHLRLIDQVTIKGQAEQVTIYEIFDTDPPELIALKQKTLSLFQQGVDLYHQGEKETARHLFEKVLQCFPDDNVARRYWERCRG